MLLACHSWEIVTVGNSTGGRYASIASHSRRIDANRDGTIAVASLRATIARATANEGTTQARCVAGRSRWRDRRCRVEEPPCHRPAWLKLVPKERFAFVGDVIRPLLAKHPKVSMRFFEVVGIVPSVENGYAIHYGIEAV